MSIKTLFQSSVSGGSNEEDSFLHATTSPVFELTAEIQQIVRDLRDTLWAYPFCHGLSAPQIGYPYAITVINVARESQEDDMVLINPKILKISGKKDRKRESCMSVWGKSGEVERRDKITIQYNNENFDLVQASFLGFQSRTIQHEIDHLNGVLFLEKMIPESELQDASFFDGFSIIKG